MTTEDKSLTNLFEIYKYSEKPPIIELLDINNKPVGALYLDKIRCDQLVVSETNHSEKYCVYIDGILIYFSYFRKITG